MSQNNNSSEENNKKGLNFIERVIEEHNKSGRFEQRVHTRFPPEPNGFLHIGHAKAICVNFGIAQKYGGKTNLRFDDTNPAAEETKFVDAIRKDVQWLGFDWEDREFYASNYFQQLYDYAVDLIKKGYAYVDHSSTEQMDEEKKAGKNSPYRERSVEENLELFEQMRKGELDNGTCVLRAKIDMTHNNWLMRDPVIYRIKKEAHHRTGDAWNIYPMYDWAHGLSDSIEGITHSLCSLEFEVHRELYDWCLEKLGVYQPQQIEFSRLNMNYTVTSKRKLKSLIEEGIVSDWDDPRMPTISGMRRRGYTSKSVRDFIELAGISRRTQILDLSKLEYAVRQDLNQVAARVMTVLDPVKVVITNYPEGQSEDLTLINNPEDESMGSRTVPFGREIYIERDDFTPEAPNRKYRRLAVGKNVRLKGAYIITCEGYEADENGKITEIHCTYHANSKSGQDESGIKAKGTLHWVKIDEALPVEVRLYDRLFSDPTPDAHKDEEGKSIDFKNYINADSLSVVQGYAEPALASTKAGDQYQFMRIGYFCTDESSTEDKIIFNRTVTLKDSWAKRS